MKQETNNEMDLLLRRLGRRQDEPASNGDGQFEHLDADELSAYAENALPAVARARYTEHLAECARCRELIVSLSASAGVVVAPETAKVLGPSGFAKFLAGLFSPMVLRYAAPALGLVLIAVIGLIVLRRPEDGHTDFVAQAPPQEAAQQPASDPKASPQIQFSIEDKKPDALAKNAPSKAGEQQQAPVPNAPPVVSVDAQVRQDAAANAAAPPAPRESPAAPKVEDSVEETKSKKESEPRKEVEVNAGRATIESEPPPPANKAYEPTIAERRAVEIPARSRGLGSLAGAQGAQPSKVTRDGEADKDNSNYVETRTVSGRTFRKENGIWVDTAYSTARSTMVLTRNSEQFRALVADEPAIKTIADQLDGEIIVVWKARAYRIR